jgi:hypothetical protein
MVSPRQRQRLPTAVTIKERIVVLNVQSNRKNVSHGFLAGIFGTLDRFGIVVDLISTSEVFVSMAIEDILDRKLQTRLVRDLEKIGTVRIKLLFPRGRANPPPSPLVRRACACALTPLLLGVFASRHGDLVYGRQADAQHGRHRRAHVHDACAGQCEHRDDQPGRERDQHLVRPRRPRRRQGPQPHSSELSPDQARRTQGPWSVPLTV